MKEIAGDLIELAQKGHFDVIVHGCNCFCSMGKGIALSIKRAFPAAHEADLGTGKGDKSKLGRYSSANIQTDSSQLVVVNAYTQYRYGRGGPHADLEAIREVFSLIKRDFQGKRIGYPMIGAGLAGGKWSEIVKIIQQELDGEDHTLVIYAPKKGFFND